MSTWTVSLTNANAPPKASPPGLGRLRTKLCSMMPTSAKRNEDEMARSLPTSTSPLAIMESSDASCVCCLKR